MTVDDHSTPGERLKAARKRAKFKSGRSAAVHWRWALSSYAAHENGTRTFDLEDAERYGRAFRVNAGWLLTGEDALAPDWARELESDAEPATTIVPVMGYIGAGGEVEPDYEQIPPDGIYQVELPFAIPGDLIAFEVRGPSMLPKYEDGDVVVAYREQGTPVEALIGSIAAVRTADQRRFIKRVMPGPQRFLYNLESFNAPTIPAARIEWASEIVTTFPKGQVKRIERARREARRFTSARPSKAN